VFHIAPPSFAGGREPWPLGSSLPSGLVREAFEAPLEEAWKIPLEDIFFRQDGR
jgi:hypothetical protein